MTVLSGRLLVSVNSWYPRLALQSPGRRTRPRPTPGPRSSARASTCAAPSPWCPHPSPRGARRGPPSPTPGTASSPRPSSPPRTAGGVRGDARRGASDRGTVRCLSCDRTLTSSGVYLSCWSGTRRSVQQHTWRKRLEITSPSSRQCRTAVGVSLFPQLPEERAEVTLGANDCHSRSESTARGASLQRCAPRVAHSG